MRRLRGLSIGKFKLIFIIYVYCMEIVKREVQQRLQIENSYTGACLSTSHVLTCVLVYLQARIPRGSLFSIPTESRRMYMHCAKNVFHANLSSSSILNGKYKYCRRIPCTESGFFKK